MHDGESDFRKYQGPNLVYQHGLPHIEGQESTRGVNAYCMLAGGVPFGRPIQYGVTSLSETDRRIFRDLNGYHAFDAYERIDPTNRLARFSLQACSSYNGDYEDEAVRRARSLRVAVDGRQRRKRKT